MKTFLTTLLLMGIVTFLLGCKTYSVPEGAIPVSPFDKDRYLGTWYEIARFDFKFEKDLNNTTATYSLNPDGTIKVVNRGYNYVKGEWKQAIGKGKFVAEPTVARLKVSFFGPFYGGYNVVALDDEYQYALISGSSLEYLWILARTKTMPDSIKNSYVAIAEEIGFDTSQLIWVEHNP